MFKINSDVHGYSTRHADDYHISFSGTNSFKILFATILVEHYVILIRCILHVKGRYDSSINVQSSITSHQNTASYHAAFQLWTCQRRWGYPAAVSDTRRTFYVIGSSADFVCETCFQRSCSSTDWDSQCVVAVKRSSSNTKVSSIVFLDSRSWRWMLKMLTRIESIDLCRT